MSEAFGIQDLFSYSVNKEEKSASFTPGPRWGDFLNVARGDEGKLRALGGLVETTVGIGIHAGMIEFYAEHFAAAAEPPLSATEERTFTQGAMAQYELMLDLDRARGGQL